MGNENMLLKLVNDTNHSLELEGKPIQSIEVLKEVMTYIHHFLDQGIKT